MLPRSGGEVRGSANDMQGRPRATDRRSVRFRHPLANHGGRCPRVHAPQHRPARPFLSSPVPFSSSDILQRMVNAVEKVRQRLLRASAALKTADIPYAVVGGNAVAAWDATVDEAAVRNTQDVDVLIRREDFGRARLALESAGFTYRRAAGLDIFLDQPGDSPRQGVHLIFANEIVKPGEPAANPDVAQSIEMGAFRVLNLESLAQIKLTAFRDKDRTHLRDLITVGLIDQSWPAKFPTPLATRLQSLLDTPDG